MESITRQVRELQPEERRVYEAALGTQLKENQQIILQVITMSSLSVDADPVQLNAGNQRPEWCNVYEGLSDEEIAEVESIVLNRDGWK